MGGRILIAEDELINAYCLKTIIQQNGYDVCYISKSGRDMINTALKIEPDLLIVDVYLDDEVDGIDAVIEIHKIKFIPVIYITASTDPHTVQKAKKTEMVEYLRKPLSNNAIIDAIKTIL